MKAIERSVAARDNRQHRVPEVVFIKCFLAVFAWTLAASAQLDSWTSGDKDSQGPAGCACACPTPQSGCPYCDNSSGTTRCAESKGAIPGYGNVIGIACSDYGIVRARAEVEPANTQAGMKFGAHASFTDFVVPVIPDFTDLMPAIVRVTF